MQITVTTTTGLTQVLGRQQTARTTIIRDLVGHNACNEVEIHEVKTKGRGVSASLTRRRIGTDVRGFHVWSPNKGESLAMFRARLLIEAGKTIEAHRNSLVR